MQDDDIYIEEEIINDEQHAVANNEDIEVPQKEKCLARRRCREKKSRNNDYPIVDLSWVGNVIELQDGEISVLWADGNISKVFHLLVFIDFLISNMIFLLHVIYYKVLNQFSIPDKEE